MQICRSILLLVLLTAVGISPAQVLFQNDLGQGVTIRHIEILPDGDVILAGGMDGHLFLARSAPNGDTLWARAYPDLSPSRDLRLTDDGRVSVVLNGPSNLPCIQQFDAIAGDRLGSLCANEVGMLSGMLGHWCSGADSLTYVSTDSLLHGHIDGGVAWRVGAPSLPNGEHIQFWKMMRTSSGIFVVLGKHDLEWPMRSFWLGMYSSAGALLDSIGYPCYPTFMLRNIDRTADGGFLAYGQSGTAWPLWVRGTANAEVTSVISWSDIEVGNSGLSTFYMAGSVVRPDGTLASVGNSDLPEDETQTAFSMMEVDPEGTVQCLRFLAPEPQFIDYTPPSDPVALADDGTTFMAGPPGQWIGLAGSCGYQTGISEYSPVVEVKAYPQPSIGAFRLEGLPVGAACKAVVFDVRGKRIAEFSLAREPIVDLTNQPAGIYYARIVSEQGKCWNIPLMKND